MIKEGPLVEFHKDHKSDSTWLKGLTRLSCFNVKTNCVILKIRKNYFRIKMIFFVKKKKLVKKIFVKKIVVKKEFSIRKNFS